MNEQTTEAPVGPGDNRPPVDDFEDLRQRVEDLALTANRWLSERKEITDEDMAGKLADYKEQVSSCMKNVEAERKAKKQPHIDAGKAVDLRYNPLKTPLQKILDLIEPLQRGWLRKVREAQEAEARRQREEAEKAEREAQEAAARAAQVEEKGEGAIVHATVAAEEAAARADQAHAAAAKAEAARPRAKGDYGKRAVGLHVTHTAVVTDPLAVLRFFWGTGDPAKRHEIQTLAEKMANAAMRATKGKAEIPGAEHQEVEKAR